MKRTIVLFVTSVPPVLLNICQRIELERLGDSIIYVGSQCKPISLAMSHYRALMSTVLLRRFCN